MKIFKFTILIKNLKSVLVILLLSIQILSSTKLYGQPNSCSNLLTLYQTIGNSTDNTVSIYKYNESDAFIKTITLQGAIASGAPASAYSSVTGFFYIANDNTNNLIFNVYDPSQNFSYKGKVKFNIPTEEIPSYKGFNNLFSTPDGHLGLIKDDKLLIANLISNSPLDTNDISSIPILTTTKKTLTGIVLGTDGEGHSSPNYAADYIYYEGLIYGMNSNNMALRKTELLIINPVDGVVTRRNIFYGDDTKHQEFIKIYRSSDFGAVWIDYSGAFYFAHNLLGRIYKIDNIATDTKAKYVYRSTPSKQNDGFACESLNLKPKVNITPQNCTSGQIATISNYDPIIYSYTFNPDTQGITISPSGAINGLILNTSYIITQKSIEKELKFEEKSDDFSILYSKLPSPEKPEIKGYNMCSPSTVGSITLSPIVPNVTYILYDSNDLPVQNTTQNLNGTTLKWSNVPEGNAYYVKATLISTLLDGTQIPCDENSNRVNIIPTQPPNPQASITQHINCTTKEGIIKIDSYDANLIYVLKAYDTINHNYGAIQNFNSAIPGFDKLNQGNYKLSATNTDNCTKEIDIPFEILQDPSVPIAPKIEHTDINCNSNHGTIKVTSEPPPVSTYTYILKDVNKNEIDSATTAKPLFTNLLAGKYSVSLKIGSCSSPDIEDTIHTIADPVTEVEISKIINCENPNLGDITVTAPIGNYTYKYTTTNGTAPGPAQSSLLFTDLMPGKYYFIAIDESTKCESIPKYIELVRNITPPAKPNLKLTQPDCKVNGQIGGKIEVLNTGNFSYQLVGTAPTQSFPIQDSPIFDHLQLGKYVVYIIDKISKCVSESSDEVTIQDPNPVNPIPNITHLTDCVNENTGAILVNPELNRSYTLLYYNPTINTKYDYQDTRSDGQFNGLRAGDYLLTVTNTLTQCTSSKVSTVNPFIGIPTINDEVTKQPTCLTKGSITINDIPYEYSFDDGVTYSTINTANDLMPGAYYIRIKDANGCISEHKEIIIDELPVIPPPPIVTPTQPDCDTKGILTVTVVDYDDQYSFDDGLTFQNENIKANLPLGTYKVRIKNSSGCISEPNSVTLTDPKCPSISLLKTATFNDEDGDTFAKANETITYHFTITNTGNVPLTNITLSDLLPGIAIHSKPGILTLQPGESNSTFFSATYTILQTDMNKRSIINTATISGEGTNGTVEGISTNTTSLDPGSACDIIVYNLVSANDDGKNDLFEIGGLDCYPENSLQIYNRWGVLVFERNPYNNSDKAFKGFSEGRVTISSKEKLPTGTYFYILKYKDIDANWHNKSGYLYLSL